LHVQNLGGKVSVSKKKAKARRQKKVVKKQKAKRRKEITKEGETKPSVSEGQVGQTKPGELIGTTAG
jgi:hypothetical protein